MILIQQWEIYGSILVVGIPDNTYITVYGQTGGQRENYTVMIYNGDFSYSLTLGTDQSDQGDNDFYTYSGPGLWQFIRIIGTTGITDPIYGPEIDAVGY
jgi:hypothetical protein